MSRKPELRTIKSEADLDQLVKGDKIVINDTGAIPSMYVAAYAGRESRDSTPVFEFISVYGQREYALLLETVDKKAVAYRGDGSVSFNTRRGLHFQQELGDFLTVLNNRDGRYLNVLEQAGL